MKKKIESKFLNFIVIIILIVFVGVIYIVLGSGNLYKNTFNNQQVSSQIYKSKAMKFSIDLPSKFEIEEKFTTILLKNTEGEIQINRNGTNFLNAEDYLSDLRIKNNMTINEKADFTVNGLKGVNATVTYPGGPQDGEKIFYIYNEYAIYSLSTSSESLFDDLDKIAQSFRYTP